MNLKLVISGKRWLLLYNIIRLKVWVLFGEVWCLVGY